MVRLHAVRFSSSAAILFLLMCGATLLHARNAFVLISGGHSPWDNNYSQYLQARAVTDWFERSYPRDSVWVFFGAGNVTGHTPVFGDVRRAVKREGLTLDSWLPGTLNRNRPARREVILRALRQEILPSVANGGTLFLFVGDHGSQTRDSDAQSLIDLWSLEADAKNAHGWREKNDESLTVSDLRDELVRGLGKGRVVFLMTQCHSGGFHYLAVPRRIMPERSWFASVPDWATKQNEPVVFPRAAGFTATDERSVAAGCVADPDPVRWEGYERFIPEQLFGINLFTLERTEKNLRSFSDAHIAATLVDHTIDKPYSTSEQYLERWADLIEKRLMKDTNITDRVKRALGGYQRAMDGATPRELDLGFRERQALYRRFTENLLEQIPGTNRLLLAGTRKDLEQAMGSTRNSTNRAPTRPTGNQNRETNSTNRPRRSTPRARSETMALWTNTVQPKWMAALEGNAVTNLGLAFEFEKHLLKEESRGRDYFSSGSRGRLQEEAFWRSGYSDPATMDVTKAEAVVLWGATRRSKILAWAKTCDDSEVRTAAERLSAARTSSTNAPSAQTSSPRTNQTAVASRSMSRRVAAERILFYRRTLAAWEFLLAVNHRSALARIRELTELERTPLPQPKELVRQ